MMGSMETGKLTDYQIWFTQYVAGFKSGEAEHDRNINLKEAHTRRVCDEIRYIGENLGLTDQDLALAQVMALFHDIGRFEQYTRYGTFTDHLSVDHAEFGVTILRKKQVLGDLPEEEQDLILRAISYHNRKDLPTDETETCLYFTRMLRDADKLDIWNVFADYYRNGQGDNRVLVHSFPDTPGISPAIYDELMEKLTANYADVQNLNDFKLLQVGWVYDINFPPSFRRIHERGYLKALREALPESEQVDRIFDVVRTYLAERIGT